MKWNGEKKWWKLELRPLIMEVNHYTRKSIYCNTHVHVSHQLPYNRLLLLHSSTSTQQKIKIYKNYRWEPFSWVQLFAVCSLSRCGVLCSPSCDLTFEAPKCNSSEKFLSTSFPLQLNSVANYHNFSIANIYVMASNQTFCLAEPDFGIQNIIKFFDWQVHTIFLK